MTRRTRKAEMRSYRCHAFAIIKLRNAERTQFCPFRRKNSTVSRDFKVISNRVIVNRDANRNADSVSIARARADEKWKLSGNQRRARVFLNEIGHFAGQWPTRTHKSIAVQLTTVY